MCRHPVITLKAGALLNLQVTRLACYVGAACLVSFWGCSDAGEPNRPAVANASATVNPYNALSAIITLDASNVDSARVLYSRAGGPTQSTPFYRVGNSPVRLAVLGLLPLTSYDWSVEAIGAGAVVRSASGQVTTGALPPFLQGVQLNMVGIPTPGYVLTSVSDGDTIGFVVAFDPSGSIAWYREFNYGVPPRETKQQANGNFTVFLGSSLGGNATYGWYFEFTPDGTVVRTYAANPPYYTDLHELLLTFADTSLDKALFFGYDIRSVDLSPIGGPANAQVAGHSLLRQNASGSVDFFWSAWDHFALADWIEEPAFLKQASQGGDFDHPNSLEIDRDGNYLVSWRNFAEVTKVDSRNGNIIWRLGGTHNQFTFLNDPLAGFSGQHTARVLDNGDLLIYDNGWRHTPSESRVAQYRLDLGAKTATLVWEFRHNPPIFTGFAGSAQRLSNGNTFIAWAFAATVTEVTPSGTILWEGRLTAGGQPVLLYRAIKMPSLYQFQRP